MSVKGRRGERGLAFVIRTHAWLLCIYPRSFRARWGAEMARLFADRVRALARRSRWQVWVAWVGALADVLRTAPGEWLHVSRRRRPDRAVGGRTRPNRAARFSMERGVQELRVSIRSLMRSPGFAVVAVLTIGLGIGLNTAIFSVADAVLLRPLPYEEPDRLVLVWSRLTNRDVEHFPTSPGDFQDYRQMTTSFEEIAGVATFTQTLGERGDPEVVDAAAVTTNFFRTLGVRPAVGRDFEEADGAPNADGATPGDANFQNTVVLLSHGLWQRQFGGDPAVVGRVIDVDGNPVEIAGVLPRDFRLHMPAHAALAAQPEIWIAARIQFENASRNNVFLRTIARLAPGVSVVEAQREMDRLAADLRRRFPIKETSGHELSVVPLHEDLTSSVRPVILALSGAVFFVLLIACANVANLLLVRSTGRARELAVRAAIGGGRWQLVRHQLAESGVLALLGGALGVVLGWMGIRLLLVLEPAELPRAEAIGLNGTALGFTAIATTLAALLFGVLPALRASRPDLSAALREGGRTSGLAVNRVLRSGVVVAEVALSLVLLIGAGLMIRSFIALQKTEPGWSPHSVLTFTVPLSPARYATATEQVLFNDRLHERFAALPGVTAVSGAFPLPLDGVAMNGRWGKAEALADPAQFQQADYTFVREGYFRAMNTRLLAGRTFTPADHADSTALIVVDDVLAERAFPNADAVGQRILVRVTTDEPVWAEIIGVVEHQRRSSLAADGRQTIFFTERYGGGGLGLTWIVRASGDPLVPLNGARAVVRELDPLLPVANVSTLEASVDRAMAPTRFALILIGCFGAIALVLAAIGLYGVLAYTVRQRSAEIGLRVALGAPQASILGLVVGQGLSLGIAGIAAGTLGALALTRVMRTLLVEVTPTDPTTFVTIAAGFLAVVALASWLPARRAARVDPLKTLR